MHLSRRVEKSRQSRERLLVQTVAAADHERRRLAQQLHDDVVQDLAGVGYALSSLEEHLGATNGPVVERLEAVVCHDVAVLRAMATELYPQQLDPQNLASSISDLGAALREAGARVDVDVDEHLGLDDTTATLIYRVARESMHNAAKHAQPHNVDVRLARALGHTVLTVVDDGRGFEPTTEPAAGHLGLKLIRDTVAEAGGTPPGGLAHRAGHTRRAEPAAGLSLPPRSARHPSYRRPERCPKEIVCPSAHLRAVRGRLDPRRPTRARSSSTTKTQSPLGGVGFGTVCLPIS
jgi:two-component system NarL family sensor kinase